LIDISRGKGEAVFFNFLQFANQEFKAKVVLLFLLLLHDFFGFLDDIQLSGCLEFHSGKRFIRNKSHGCELICLLLMFLGIFDGKEYFLIEPAINEILPH
jgi:hypothetical protein